MLDLIFWSPIEERNFAFVLLCSTLFSWSSNHCSCNFFLKEVKLQEAKPRYHKTQTLQLSATSNPTQSQFSWPSNNASGNFSLPNWEIRCICALCASRCVLLMHDHETQTLSNIHPDFQCQFPWPSNYSSCNFSSQNWEIVRIWSTRCTHYHEAQDPPVIGNIKPDLHADFHGPPTTLATTFSPKNMGTNGFAHFTCKCARCVCVITKLGPYSRQQHSTSPTCQYLWSSYNSCYNFLQKL